MSREVNNLGQRPGWNLDGSSQGPQSPRAERAARRVDSQSTLSTRAETGRSAPSPRRPEAGPSTTSPEAGLSALSPRRPEAGPSTSSPRRPETGPPTSSPRRPEAGPSTSSSRRGGLSASSPRRGGLSASSPRRPEAGPSTASPEAGLSALSPRRPEAGPSTSSPRRPETGPPTSSPRRPEAGPSTSSSRRGGLSASSPRRPEAGPSTASPRRPEAGLSALSSRRPEAGPSTSLPRRPEAGPSASSPGRPETGPPTSSPRRPEAGLPTLPATSYTPPAELGGLPAGRLADGEPQGSIQQRRLQRFEASVPPIPAAASEPPSVLGPPPASRASGPPPSSDPPASDPTASGPPSASRPPPASGASGAPGGPGDPEGQEDPETCSICHDGMNYRDRDRPLAELESCNHMYHLDCIREWYWRNDNGINCPLCRRRMRGLGMIREYGPSELVDWGDPPASPDRASPDLASPDLASPDRASPDRASPGRARNALARAFQQQLGNPAPSPSDVSMRDAISVRSDNRSDNREPPPSQPSAQEGSRVQYTPGIVTHEGIRKRICGAFAAGRGHSLLLKFHSQNPDNPRLAAYDLVPVSEYRSAFAEYLSSGGQVLEKADINRLNAGDWPSLTIHGVASPRQNLGTSVDSHGNLYGDRPTNRVRAYILASTPTVSAEWYIQSELSRLFGAPQVVPAVQAHREKTGQYIPIEPSSSTVRNRRRPRGIELLQRATTQSALQNTALLSPNSPPPHSPHSPTPHSPRVDQMSDEQLTAYYDNVSRELRRRFRQSRGQPPSESTL